jgi:hypothetical protein
VKTHPLVHLRRQVKQETTNRNELFHQRRQLHQDHNEENSASKERCLTRDFNRKMVAIHELEIKIERYYRLRDIDWRITISPSYQVFVDRELLDFEIWTINRNNDIILDQKITQKTDADGMHELILVGEDKNPIRGREIIEYLEAIPCIAKQLGNPLPWGVNQRTFTDCEMTDLALAIGKLPISSLNGLTQEDADLLCLDAIQSIVNTPVSLLIEALMILAKKHS